MEKELQNEKNRKVTQSRMKIFMLVNTSSSYKFIIASHCFSKFWIFSFVIGISIFFCAFLISIADLRVSNSLKNDRPCNFLLDFEDAQLSTPEIIEKHGFPVERHWVTTEDGYILEMHRIPQSFTKKGNESCKNSKTLAGNRNKKITTCPKLPRPKPVVFLMHGTASSSRDFVINCDKRALAYQLSQNGYDVWIGNYRGNKYSRNHTILSPENSTFWDFSVDHVGYYDLPAMIDYILNTTKLRKVSIVAHSMGNGVTLGMLSTRPEYNDKVNIWFALAGALTLEDSRMTFLKFLSAFPDTIQWLLSSFGNGELHARFLNQYLPMLCRREGSVVGSYHGICSAIAFLTDGYDPGQVPPKLYSTIVGSFPSSTSVKFFVQSLQLFHPGNLVFGLRQKEQLNANGQTHVKPYSIEGVTVPTVMMYGENDGIVSPKDVLKTEAVLKRLGKESDLHPLECFKVKSPSWNHMNFVFGKDADILVYSHVIQRLKLVYQKNK